MMRHISYSEGAFRESEKLILDAREVLKGVNFDTMIGTGLSGALVVPILARAMGKHFAIIRKPEESSHGSNTYEGEIGDRWLFVDDFVSTGATYRRVNRAVNALSREYSRYNDAFQPTLLVGSYEYDRHRFTSDLTVPSLSVRDF